MTSNRIDYNNCIRALRLPFVMASVLPYIFGALSAYAFFSFVPFFLGLIAVASTHLSANLLNDYADSRSGLDWQDLHHYGFFGGSKLIQEHILSEKDYLYLSLSLGGVATVSVILLSLLFKSIEPVLYFILIILTGWSYSARPFQFSYRGLGEIVVFILFGPVPVMGGYYLQTQVFPDVKSFILSLPFGFFTAAVLFANEIPDYPEDIRSGKKNWVYYSGHEKAYLLYLLLMICAFISIGSCWFLHYCGSMALGCFFLIFPIMKAARILKFDYQNKIRLMTSSKITIIVHTVAGLILILDSLVN